MTQREAFEAWARQFHNIIAFDVRPDGLYRNVSLQREWAAWQASAARYEAVVEAARKLVDSGCPCDDCCKGVRLALAELDGARG